MQPSNFVILFALLPMLWAATPTEKQDMTKIAHSFLLKPDPNLDDLIVAAQANFHSFLEEPHPPPTSAIITEAQAELAQMVPINNRELWSRVGTSGNIELVVHSIESEEPVLNKRVLAAAAQEIISYNPDPLNRLYVMTDHSEPQRKKFMAKFNWITN